PAPLGELHGARPLAIFGDSVTTDHISPAGSIKPTSPAGKYLIGQGVKPEDFNSYGARRGNHEVMVRGTFANVRIKNLMVPGIEGGVTVVDGKQMSIYDAAMEYQKRGTPLIVFAGHEYGTGSSRDWAAKGTRLLAVRAASNLGNGLSRAASEPATNATRVQRPPSGASMKRVLGLGAAVLSVTLLSSCRDAAGKGSPDKVAQHLATFDDLDFNVYTHQKWDE